MIWAILGFAFASLGSKVLLGLGVVYVFLPDERQCSRCDAETTVIESPRGLRTIAAWARVQSRWCPRCGETCLARGAPPPRLWVGRPDKDGAPPPAATPHAFERRPQ